MKTSQNLIFFLIVTVLPNQCVKCESNLEATEKERFLYGSKMASYIDRTVDPCEDFDKFACGNYFKVNKEDKVHGRFGSVFHLHDNIQEKIHNLLIEPVNRNASTELRADEKARLYYQSCMKSDIFPYKKNNDYLEVLNSFGGWPVLNRKWKGENFNWFDALCTLSSYGINTMIEEYSYESNSDLIIGTFGLKPMKLSLLLQPYSRKFQTNKELAKRIMMIYGIPKAKAIKTFNEIIKFGMDLMELYKKSDLIHKDSDGEFTFKEFLKYMPEVNWTKYYSITRDEKKMNNLTICVDDEYVLKKLPSLFRGKNIKRAANYFALKALYQLHSELESEQDLKSYCIHETKSIFNPIITAIFLQSKYHNKNIEDEILTMASYIRAAFRDTVKMATWYDKETLKGAQKNIQNIDIQIGDQELYFDIDELDKKYTKFHVNNGSYQENRLNALQYLSKYLYNDYLMEMDGIVVNAFFGGNTLTLPGGIYRQPFYYPELPKSYNFGAIGSIIGHEFGHSVDGGQLYHNDWWKNSSTAEFEKRKKCILDQYGSYKVKELNKNLVANETIRDDIADNVGIKFSFYGYKKWMKANEGSLDPSKQTLPGLNVTDTQLLFLSFAQLWCESLKGYKSYKTALSGGHSPGRWRNIGSLRNFDEFGKAFNCKLGSKMNPEKKCIIW